MTEEQIQFLKDNNIPYSPSLFISKDSNFRKYCAYLRLAAFRCFGWEDSEYVEETFGKKSLKYYEERTQKL